LQVKQGERFERGTQKNNNKKCASLNQEEKVIYINDNSRLECWWEAMKAGGRNTLRIPPNAVV
jgi:hypothetical protein